MNVLIREAAKAWNVPPRLALILFYAPLAISVLLLLTFFVDLRIMGWLGREDSIFEWITFVAFVAAAILALINGRSLWRADQRFIGGLYILAGLLAFFIAGEEISWAQRVIGFETPEALREMNSQGELNLHNTHLSPFAHAPMIAGAYGAFIYLLDRFAGVGRFAGRGRRFLVVPFFLASLFFVTVAWLVLRLVGVLEFTGFVIRYTEWVECTLGIGLLLFMWTVWRHLRRPSANEVMTTSEHLPA